MLVVASSSTANQHAFPGCSYYSRLIVGLFCCLPNSTWAGVEMWLNWLRSRSQEIQEIQTRRIIPTDGWGVYRVVNEHARDQNLVLEFLGVNSYS